MKKWVSIVVTKGVAVFLAAPAASAADDLAARLQAVLEKGPETAF